MKRSILEKAYNENLLIGIRTNNLEWGESIIGFIVSLEDSLLTLNEIDINGFLIGNTKIALEEIINIDINDRYQKRLLFIYNNKSKFDINRRVTIWQESEAIIPHLKILIESKKIVTIFLNEDDYVIGFILNYDESYILIENIGIEGDEDGISYYPIDKIVGLRYDGLEEQKIKLLYENRRNFY